MTDPLTMPRIYVCGPFTLPDPLVNMKTAIDAADALLEMGCAPYLPHLSGLWHLLHPHDYETWLALDLVWLAQCEAVLRLPGASAGADRETACARDVLHIPVFATIQEVAAWGQGRLR